MKELSLLKDNFIMKRIIKYFSLLFLIVILCGCSIKNDNNIVISKDGKIKYDIVIAFDKELLSNMVSINNISEEKNKDKDLKEYFDKNIKDSYLDGIKKEDYSDKKYIGNKYSYEINNIDEVSSERTDDVIINDYSSDEKLKDKELFKKDKDTYTANFIYNSKNNTDYGNINYVNTFTVSLQNRSKSNNADEVKDNGKTLIWHIDSQEERKINFSFSFKNNKYIISIISILFDVVLIVIFFHYRKVNI